MFIYMYYLAYFSKADRQKHQLILAQWQFLIQIGIENSEEC